MKTPMKATKKPVTIDFIEWTGGNHRPMFEFLGGSKDDYLKTESDAFYIDHGKVDGGLVIKHIQGPLLARIGDMIIKSASGKFYPQSPRLFALTYDIDDQ